ncbi:MAG: YfhO family protein [Planctomycetota bacterium]|jgi:hypothetical protein
MLRRADQSESPSSREAVFACVLVAIAAAGIFQELVRRPTDLLVGVHSGGRNDLTSQFLRYREMPPTLMRHFGEWSNWDPHLALGLPVHGNPQAGLLYPPNWLCFVFGAEQTLSWLMIGHLWLGGVGVWMLARHFGLSRPAALIGAIAATGAPYLVAHLAEGHVAQLFTVAWVPWILLAFERFLNSAGRHWRMLPVFVALSFFAGHVQELYYLMLLLTGCVVISAWREQRAGNSGTAKSLLIHWALAGGISIGLACGDLIPVWMNSRLAVRSERLPLNLAGDGLSVAHVLQLLNPFALGQPEETASKHGFYWTKLFHFGVTPLLLAALAILGQWKRSQTRRLFWMLTVAVIFAFGNATPFFAFCYRVIPVLGSFRVPTRVLFLCSFFIALLAAIGANAMFGRRIEDQKGTAARRRVSLGSLFAVAVAAVIGFELWRHADRVLETADRASLRRNSAVTDFLSRSDKTDVSNPGRILAMQDLYSDVESFADGVQRIRGYEPVPQVRLAWAIDALFDVPDGELDFAGFRDCDLTSLNDTVADLLGVRYVVTARNQPAASGWRRVTSGSVPPPVQVRDTPPDSGTTFQIYENLDVLPRAFVVGTAVECGGLETQKRIDQVEQLDPRQSVQLKRDVLPDGVRSEFKTATIDQYKGNRVVVSVDIDAPGYLVLTDLFHPGWSATVDGKPVNILPANLALRAVPLEPGQHVVGFRYQCPGQKLGLSITAVSVLLLLISAAVSRRRSTEPAPGV